jgi:peptidoglycan/LPS O-acetylase OafA/YrhL
MPQTPTQVSPDPTVAHPVEPTQFTSTQASVLLDVLRGMAALLVLLGHMRFLLFQDLSLIPEHRWIMALPYMILATGHQAVIVFFVLSGYLVSASVFRALDRGVWSWPSYLLHRVLRLWIVLIPTLLIGAVWDYIGLHLRNQGAILLYSGKTGDHLVTRDIHLSYHPLNWIGTMFFLHGTSVTAFGSNGALWSLANEFWYYMLFPLALLTFLRKTAVRLRGLYICLFFTVAYFVNREILELFPIWLLGVLLAKLPIRSFTHRTRIIATLLWAPTMILAMGMNKMNIRLPADWFFGLCTTAYIWVLLSARGHAPKGSLYVSASRTLARFSYTLYATHTPPLLVAAGLTLGVTRWNPDLHHLLLGFTIFCGLVTYAFCMATVTEFRTDSVRSWIERKVPWTAPGRITTQARNYSHM